MTTDDQQAAIITAGHICLDVIPTFAEQRGNLAELLTPGKLIDVGTAVFATGGSVANTGLALHRLGVPTRLMGKIGDDLFGQAILERLTSHDPALADGMIVAGSASTSYTIVISPPGTDRIFLHNPGANHTFMAADVDQEQLDGASFFHFGYPPLMRQTYADGGRAFATLMKQIKGGGLATSLDMAFPDPDSEAGRVNWQDWLARVLPHVDIFLPSLDEILFMLGRSPVADSTLTGALLHEVAEQLLAMGTAVVVLKLGDRGLYLRTPANSARIRQLGAGQPANVAAWQDCELLAPCFRCEVVGTTGAGDCTIAGFLAGLSKGLPPESVATMAVAVGGFNVESADATGRIPHWRVVEERVAAGWPRLQSTIKLDGWRWVDAPGVWQGPGG